MKRKGRDYSFYESIVGHKPTKFYHVDEYWEEIENKIREASLKGSASCSFGHMMIDKHRKQLIKQGFVVVDEQTAQLFGGKPKWVVRWPYNHNNNNDHKRCREVVEWVEKTKEQKFTKKYSLYPLVIKQTVFTCLLVFNRLNKTIDAKISKDIKMLLIQQITDDWKKEWCLKNRPVTVTLTPILQPVDEPQFGRRIRLLRKIGIPERNWPKF